MSKLGSFALAVLPFALLTFGLTLTPSESPPDPAHRQTQESQDPHLRAASDSPSQPSSSGEDLTLEATKFSTLEVGMSREEVEDVVGTPDFERPYADRIERVYLLPGDKHNSYKFIKLNYDPEKDTLLSGFYEQPAGPDSGPDTSTSDLRALPYLG